MGKMVCIDRNWQEQIKTIIFGLIKVQFHWIGKYLCKIEIVENSIFVFQVLPPQDSKLSGLKKKEKKTALQKKGELFLLFMFFIVKLVSLKNENVKKKKNIYYKT